MKTLEENLVSLLIEKNLKVATAESCTGGLVAHRITKVSGASSCFDLGVVTYSNEQKMKILKVKKESLENYGAVSEEVALQMSEGIKNLSGADFTVGITGLAGPGGATKTKPVGLVYISICGGNIHKAYKFNFDGDRESVQKKASDEALKLLISSITE